MPLRADQFDASYYAANYRNYAAQNPPAKMAFYRSLLAKHLPPSGARRILELGCASGLFLGSLDASWHRFGIDPSEYAIAAASKRMPDVRLAVASATDVPFLGPFDAVVAFDTIEHIENLESMAGSVRTVLSPGGIFVFVVPVYDGPLGPLVHQLDRDPTHVHKYGRDFWLSWTESNFDLLEWRGIFRYLLPRGPYIHWPTRLFRGVAPAIAVVASTPRKL